MRLPAGALRGNCLLLLPVWSLVMMHGPQPEMFRQSDTVSRHCLCPNHRSAPHPTLSTLQMLNAAGYGQQGSGLQLDLVYNPGAAFLAPPQSKLEPAYKQVSRLLAACHGWPGAESRGPLLAQSMLGRLTSRRVAGWSLQAQLC